VNVGVRETGIAPLERRAAIDGDVQPRMAGHIDRIVHDGPPHRVDVIEGVDRHPRLTPVVGTSDLGVPAGIERSGASGIGDERVEVAASHGRSRRRGRR